MATFHTYGRGVATCRDDVVYGFSLPDLGACVKWFIDHYNCEVDRFRRTGTQTEADDFVRYDAIKWSRDLKLDLQRGRYAAFDEAKLRTSSYRPFCTKHLFFDRILNEEVYVFPRFFPTLASELENQVICVSGPGHDVFCSLAARRIVELKFSNSTNGGTQCFPFFVYDEDGSNRRENVTDWALKQFREHYGSKAASRERQRPEKGAKAKNPPVADAPGSPVISKWDIFHYVYGILHHPGYRTKFADNLKRELPRIPFAPDFWAFARAGQELARLHLDYEQLEPYPLQFVETEGVPLSYRVEDKMRLTADKTELRVNPSLILAGIPPEVFGYRLGNRSALEWVIDQYRVTEDQRSGIRSDPNRADDPEYIVRLVGQVVRVSLETVRIVAGLPEQFAETAVK
jgi:predicted helicase